MCPLWLGSSVPSSCSSNLLFLLVHLSFQLCWPGSILMSLSPHGCCTLREPATGALTTHAFIRSCAHMPFALTLLQDLLILWPPFKPHPSTAGPHLQARTRLSQILFLALIQEGGLKEDPQSKIAHPRWTRTSLKKSVFVNPPRGLASNPDAKSKWPHPPLHQTIWSVDSTNRDTNHCCWGFSSDKHLGQL